MDKKTIKVIEDSGKELLEKLMIEGKIKVEVDEGEVVHLSVDAPDSGVLIGYHGETISAFQLILGLIVYKKVGKWTRIVVNVGDYREKREEALKQMADRIVDQVKQTGQPVIFPFLNSGERRIIHLYLQENKEIICQSEGEGISRRLVIKPAETEKEKTTA